MGRPRKRSESVKVLIRIDARVKETLEHLARGSSPAMSVNDVIGTLVTSAAIDWEFSGKDSLSVEDLRYRRVANADVEKWIATELERYVQVLGAAMGSVLGATRINNLIENIKTAALRGPGPELWRHNAAEAMGHPGDTKRDSINNPLAGTMEPAEFRNIELCIPRRKRK